MSCDQSAESAGQNPWLKGARSLTLQGARTRLKMPPTFIKSSPYRLNDDLPGLEEKPLANALTQAKLEELSAEFENIDILIDTAATLHYLLVLTTDRTPLDEDAGALLDSQEREQFQELKDRFKRLDVKRVNSNLKEGADRKALLYQYRLQEKSELFWTAYMITTELRTYRIFELADGPENMEKFLWTLDE